MNGGEKRGWEVYLKILLDFLIAILALLVIIFIVPRAINFFLPFVIGWIIAIIANPMVRFLEKKVKIVRKHGSAIIIVVTIAAVVGLLYIGIASLGREIMGLIKDLPNLYLNLQQQLAVVSENLYGFYEVMPKDVQDFIMNAGSNIMELIGSAVSNMKGPTVGDAGLLVKNVAEGFLMAIIVIMSAYFFIADREYLAGMAKEIAPESIQKQVAVVKDNFSRAIGGYFKAQFKIMIVITVILFIGFQLLRVNYSFLFALGIAFLDFLPVFGTGTVIFPWAVMDLVSGNYFRAACLVVIYLVCQVVRQILQPKMVGDSIGLSPLATLVFMFVGYRVKGILGMIIGIPIGMAIINLYKAGVFDHLMRGMRIIIHDINEYRKY